MNRAERRRQARAQLRDLAARPDVDKIAGVWTELDQHDIGAQGVLPEKIPGKHRWMAMAAYVLTDAMVRNEQAHQAGEGGPMTILDHETRFEFSIGCWDCEQPFPVATPDTECPA